MQYYLLQNNSTPGSRISWIGAILNGNGYDMPVEIIEGIVLRSVDFKERHRIITLFTPGGLLSVIVKNISRKNTSLISLTTPFCHAEYHVRSSQSELRRFYDGTVLNDHFNLRQSLSFLQTAGSLANAILASQMPGKPAASLFALYKAYHKHVVDFADPSTLLASFYLKLLKHEGLLHLSPNCSQCEKPVARVLDRGESVCADHHNSGALMFTSAEWKILLELDNARNFPLLKSQSIEPILFAQIRTLFQSSLAL